jgi:hypothetical protein
LLTFQQGNFNAEFGRAIAGLVTADGPHTVQERVPRLRRRERGRRFGAGRSCPSLTTWSVALAARRSYIDAVLPAVLSLIPGANDAIGFTLAPALLGLPGAPGVEASETRASSRFFVSVFGSL